jgi:hypothetical protein
VTKNFFPADNQLDGIDSGCGGGCQARHGILIRLSRMAPVVVGVHLPHARQTGTQGCSAQPICPHKAPAERSSVHVNRRAGQTSYSRDERTLGGYPLGMSLTATYRGQLRKLVDQRHQDRKPTVA